MFHLNRWISLALILIFSGCSTPPAPDAGFIDSSRTHYNPDLPFQKVWMKEGSDWKNYTGIYIAPVNISYALKAGSWKALTRYGKAQEDLQTVAEYMKDTFIKAFQADPHHRFKVVNSPSQGDIVLELAIVELTPNSPAMKAASFIPVIGLGFTAANAMDPDYVSFEARIVDGGTGDVIAMVGDRRKPKTSIVNAKDLTWFGHAHAIIQDWANEFVQVANKRPGEAVKRASGFDLKPW